jgi:hypothetical protein
MKQAYSPPASELPGVKTWVSNPSEKGLPPPGAGSPEDNYKTRPSTPENKQQALPITQEHKKEREKHQPEPDKPSRRPVMNTPPSSSETDGKPLHERPRTRGVPGEEYGHPWKDDGNGSLKRRVEVTASEVARRWLESGLKDIFPSGPERQKKQKGKARIYYQKYYKRRRALIKTKARRRYKKIKRRTDYKRDVKYRRKFPEKYKRRPGGYAENRTRAKDWREDQKEASLGLFPLKVWLYGYDGEAYIQNLDDDGILGLLYEGDLYDIPIDEFMDMVVFQSEADEDRFFEFLDQYFEYEEPSLAKVADFYLERKKPSDRMQSEENTSGVPSGEDENAQEYGGSRSWVVPMSHPPGLIERRDKDNPGTPGDYGQVDNNPGSAKVIPDGHDFENRKAIKLAAKISEILNQTGPGIHDKAKSLAVTLEKSLLPKRWVLFYNVQGSEAEPYRIKVKFLPGSKNVRDHNKLDVRITCSCNFWQWQGPEYWASQGKYLYGRPRGTATLPNVRDPKKDHHACKHVIAVLNRLAQKKVFLYRGKTAGHYQVDITGKGRRPYAMADDKLRQKLLRLAKEKPELRKALIPLLREKVAQKEGCCRDKGKQK